MLPILGGILSGVLGLAGANRAANAQAGAAQNQLAFNQQVYDDISANFKPYLDMGLQGQQAYNSLLGLGQAPAGFTGFQQSPGYQFAMNQGMDASRSQAAAMGGLNSGRTLRDLNAFGQGLANQEYQTYLNRLQGIGQQGQSAAGMQGAAGQQFGANALNAMGSLGDARAAGYVGGANALMGGINNAVAGWGYMQANPQAQGANWLGLGR
jgi:hypothetical protein